MKPTRSVGRRSRVPVSAGAHENPLFAVAFGVSAINKLTWFCEQCKFVTGMCNGFFKLPFVWWLLCAVSICDVISDFGP